MADQQTVIYAARTMQEAHLLRNILAESGIKALVINDMLQGGSGVDIVGWPTLSRVVVPQSDAVQARQIALDFEQRLASGAESLVAEASPAVGGEDWTDVWPTCPQCGARRTTRCPVCGTAGTDLPPADAGFGSVLGLRPSTAGAGPCCGPNGCSPAGPCGQELPSSEVPEQTAPRAMLICPTCDEPFEPEYPRRCEWCGHEFPDGYAVDLRAPVLAEPLNTRVFVAIGVVVGLGIAAAIYFAVLFRS